MARLVTLNDGRFFDIHPARAVRLDGKRVGIVLAGLTGRHRVEIEAG